MDNKLQEWTTPRLMRLNQADGTEKHVMWIESQTAPSPQPTYCGLYSGTFFGGSAAPAPCGPS